MNEYNAIVKAQDINTQGQSFTLNFILQLSFKDTILPKY
jgi:hypothetical protein